MKSNAGILVRAKPTQQPIITGREHLPENLDETTLLTFHNHCTKAVWFLSLLLLFQNIKRTHAHAHTYDIHVSPINTAISCGEVTEVRRFSGVLSALFPPHLAWFEMSDLGNDKVHCDRFSSLHHKRCFTSYFRGAGKNRQGGKSIPPHSSKWATVLWDPSLPACGGSAVLSLLPKLPPGTWPHFTQ